MTKENKEATLEIYEFAYQKYGEHVVALRIPGKGGVQLFDAVKLFAQNSRLVEYERVKDEAAAWAKRFVNQFNTGVACAVWNSMETAPRDGTVIRLKVGEMTFLARWTTGHLDEQENPCGMWAAEEADHHPTCWHDGYCWGSNADESPSEWPDAWQPYIKPVK